MTTIGEVIKATAAAFHVGPRELQSPRRGGDLRLARQVAYYVARKVTKASLPAIGRAFDDRDHTTIAHGINRIEQAIETDRVMAAMIEALVQGLDYRETIQATGEVDVLATAQRITFNPRQEAIGASAMEIAALAKVLLDLWEIACMAEEMAEATEQDLAAALGRGIRQEMAALRGTKEETRNERA